MAEGSAALALRMDRMSFGEQQQQRPQQQNHSKGKKKKKKKKKHDKSKKQGKAAEDPMQALAASICRRIGDRRHSLVLEACMLLGRLTVEQMASQVDPTTSKSCRRGTFWSHVRNSLGTSAYCDMLVRAEAAKAAQLAAAQAAAARGKRQFEEVSGSGSGSSSSSSFKRSRLQSVVNDLSVRFQESVSFV